MDSSRSGLLSTLLMTLPLIVVPAIALLRPPGSLNGVSTAALNASDSEEDDFLNNELDELTRNFGGPKESGDKPDRKDSSDDIDQLFGEEFPDSSESGHKPDGEPSSGRAKSRSISPDPFMPSISEQNGRAGSESTPADAEEDPSGSAEMIVERSRCRVACRLCRVLPRADRIGENAFRSRRTDTRRMRPQCSASGHTLAGCTGCAAKLNMAALQVRSPSRGRRAMSRRPLHASVSH